MATTLVASNIPQPAAKRYRPAPAKTFQCRGYGECRMVFSRSEHLARHVRKHTGERPFTCHCSKQFSRLDNLRQHAQTVHADKQDQNERMMRDLTSLHASMAAANKATQSRGGRRVPKQEPIDARPGTSTGYEGVWHVDTSHSFRDQQQSFREQPGQSFRQSFLSLNATGVTTANSLPPLAQIVPGSSRGPYRPGTAPEPTSYGGTGLEPSPESPIGGFYDSPFSFHPPPNTTEPPPAAVPRKRTFGGANGPAPDDTTPNAITYDYGTESRPQSRRLSVLELCNDRDDGPSLLAGGPASRPNTSSGLVSSAKALALVDREQLEYRTEYASSHTEPSRLVVEPTAGAGHSVRTGIEETTTRANEESGSTEERGRGIFELARSISSATGDGSGSSVLSSSASRTVSSSLTSTVVNSFAYTSSFSNGGDLSPSAASSGTSSSASSPISPRTCSPTPHTTTKSSSPIHFSAPGFTARVGLSSDANYLSRHAHITDQVRGARYGDVVVGMRI